MKKQIRRVKKEKEEKIEIPEFIKQDFGSTPSEIIEKKSSEPQTKEISGGDKPLKIKMSKEECQALCSERGIEYKDGYENRVLSYVCSDESVDRAGDIIRQEGWCLENYRKNPVVMFAHDYGKMPVGNSLRESVDGETKQLKMDILFPDKDVSEDSDKIFKMASSGFMKAGSVGFLPKKVNNDMTKKEREELGMTPWGVEFLSQELLEHTVCGVPCNSNALQNSIDKGLMRKADFKNWVKDERLKELNDLEDVEDKPYPNEHSCRLKDPEEFSNFKRGTREHDGKKYSIIFGKSEDGSWEEQAYRYQKDEWKSEDARKHCEEHGGNFEPAKSVNADSVDAGDEKTKIMASVDLEALAKALNKVIEKQNGQQEPEKKVGAVLSKKNKEIISKAVSATENALTALKDLLTNVSQEQDTDEEKDFSDAFDILTIDDESEEAEAGPDIYSEVLEDATKELKTI